MKLQAKFYRAGVYAGTAFSVGVLVMIVGYILIKGIPTCRRRSSRGSTTLPMYP